MSKLIVGGVAAVAIYVWDDILLGAPVAFLAGYWGVVQAFVMMSILYGVGSYFITELLVLNNDRIGANERLSVWLEKLVAGSHGKVSRKLISVGGGLGLFLSSWLAGGILTTLGLKLAGYEGDLKRLAVVSNAIFAVMFCAQYAGLGLLLKELIANMT